jgi:hypothetical protein
MALFEKIYQYSILSSTVRPTTGGYVIFYQSGPEGSDVNFFQTYKTPPSGLKFIQTLNPTNWAT